MTTTPRPQPDPPCPYCGERQTYADAISVWIGRKGRETEQHCRTCDRHIIFGFTFGSGSVGEIMTGEQRYHWTKGAR